MQSKQSNLELLRHSTAHILAAAVLEMFPEAKFAVGPAVENGFYYDFDLPRTLIPEDLPLLEEKMKAIIKANYAFEKAELPVDEAMEKFKELNQVLKQELIDDLHKAGNQTVTIYKSGPLVDLCSGPHIESTGKIDPRAFALTKISGAYWKGDANNQQLQRIYGVVFENKEGLKNYHNLVLEAAKRDHRKLGKELDLFCFSDLVGPGLPLFTPNGTIIKDELQKHIEKVCRGYGFQKVSTPHLAKIDLYEKSGHAQKFGDELFQVASHYKQNYVMKPVQCPHQTQIFASQPRSYKDLPIRYMESEKQYRDEKPGEIGGLQRVIAITVEDGHSFCTVDQVKQEVKNMVEIIQNFYTSLGMWDNHSVSLSVRDYAHPEKYIGEASDWDECEKMLQDISDEMGLNAIKHEGEAALYGPKLDFMFHDSLGKEIQIPTVQLDFATPKRFDLQYSNNEGGKSSPVMVHRAILGSYERFIMLLIEHFAGAFPLWLSPVQVSILPISEKFADYAEEVRNKFLENDIRVKLNDKAESLGKRISEEEKQKTPYIIVVGEKEAAEKTVAVRTRGIKDPASAELRRGEQQTISLEEFVEKIISEIKEKK
ncbi:MAG: threonine--tRNA ligase [Candidatus Moranbacteria bacterium]|nr:threonine--tRNA ligase [Candidatus Moranbacteria bacterium]